MAGIARDILSVVNPSRMDWGFRVRVVRKYELPNYKNKSEVHSVELVFQDREGTRIHASMRKSLIQEKGVKLREHEVYIMKNFAVVKNNSKYKTTSHPYKLLFMKTTHIAQVDDGGFPSDIFKFKPFNDIIGNHTMDEDELFDVIGEITGSDIVKHQGAGENLKKLIDLEIRDFEDKRLLMTLWGDEADMVDDIIKKAGKDTVILILQMGRAKNFMDDMKVCNTFYVSKVFGNPLFPQAQEFRERLLNGTAAPSQGISQISGPNIYSIVDDLDSGTHEFITIEQLIEVDEVTKYWLIVTIQEVESEEDWWYLGCKKCSKKLVAQDRNFFCGKCGVASSSGIPKFKLQVRVGDGTGSVVLLMWDKECVQMIGKTAKELRECIAKDVEARTYPVDVDSLVERKILCKVEVRPQNIIGNDEVYNVLNFTSDPELITKYEVIIREKVKNTKLSIHNGYIGLDSKSSMSENDSYTPSNSQREHVEVNGMDDEVVITSSVEAGPSSSMSTNKTHSIVKIEK